VLLVEGQLREEIIDVFLDQGAVATHPFAGHAAVQRIEPAAVGHGLLESVRVAFLENLVDCDQRLEGLHLVGHDRLAAET
jgi:hypothetical protein